MAPVNTTLDRPDTVDSKSQVPAWALVLLWADSEFHRAGELAFLPGFEPIIVGRQDNGTEMYARFGKQRPGEPYGPRGPESLIAGDGISRRQLRFLATAVGVEVENVGRCPMLVNGEKKTTATLKEGDTVLLLKEALFMVVRRPRTIEGPRALHAYGGPDANGIVGETPGMWALRARLALLAPTDDYVLVQGESGTGKDLVGLAIHRGSKRAKGPWAPHNASNFTLTIIDSDLYGNVANYPNPGTPARLGILGSADGGTLFLDEIGDCPLEVQAHLLRVLDAGEYRRVGDAAVRHVDMRVVGATNKDDSAFRTDFRARFGWTVGIPPLRERREDIPLLIRHWMLLRGRKDPAFGKQFLRQGPTGGMEPRISGRLVDYIVRQPLPLNFRELNGFLLEALAASPGDELRLPERLSDSDAVPPSAPESPGARARGPARVPTKEQLFACLERVGWNQSHAGEELGIHRNKVRELIKEYGLKRDETAK